MEAAGSLRRRNSPPALTFQPVDTSDDAGSGTAPLALRSPPRFFLQVLLVTPGSICESVLSEAAVRVASTPQAVILEERGDFRASVREERERKSEGIK